MHSEGILNRQSLAIKESWRLGFHFSHKRNRPEPQDVRGNPMLLAEKEEKRIKSLLSLSIIEIANDLNFRIHIQTYMSDPYFLC